MNPNTNPWWYDWPKFGPGWLALLVTTGTLARRWWVRRHRLALGPDDAGLRDRLTSTRVLFEEIASAGGKTKQWFEEAERKETARTLRDLSERRGDRTLRGAIQKVATAWDEASAQAPPDRILFAWLGVEPSPEHRAERAADDKVRGVQVEIARRGTELVGAALACLNSLEQRTTGRS